MSSPWGSYSCRLCLKNELRSFVMLGGKVGGVRVLYEVACRSRGRGGMKGGG